MPHAHVLDMPTEFDLELVTMVCSHRMDSERKTVNHMVDEINGIGLGMALVDLQGPDPERRPPKTGPRDKVDITAGEES